MVAIGYIAAFDGRRTYLVSLDGELVDRFSSYQEALEFAASLCGGLGYEGMYAGANEFCPPLVERLVAGSIQA